MLGNFYRAGTYYGTEPQKVNGHDFPSFSDGKIILHGIYDVGDNKGYLSLGTTKDTSEFVCHNFGYFWQKQLQWKYYGKEWMLFLCDSGGSNNCRYFIFKEDLYKTAQRLQMNIVVAHYPSIVPSTIPSNAGYFALFTGHGKELCLRISKLSKNYRKNFDRNRIVR